jgi:hypothetical protein
MALHFLWSVGQCSGGFVTLMMRVPGYCFSHLLAQRTQE